MDEYSKMALFNPYLQMALGILSGNTGRSKSEAFANAMGGGLSAAQRAQQVAFEQQRSQREQQEWDLQQKQLASAQQWATDMQQKDPANAEYYKIMAANPMYGIKLFQTFKDVENDQARTNAYIQAASMRGGGGGGGGGGTASGVGFVPDLGMSDVEFATMEGLMKQRYGQAWDTLSKEQRRGYAAQAINAIRQQAKQGVGIEGTQLPPLPTPEPSGFEQFQKNVTDFLTPGRSRKTGPIGSTTKGSDEPAPEMDDGVVTDSSGRKWKYKGKGDPTKQENYVEVK